MLLYKFSKFAFAFTVLFFHSKVNCQDCGQGGTGNRSMLMNGESPTDGEWPWMVAITMQESPGDYHLYCTGFLIDRKHVLTSAHCFDATKDEHQYSTRIGRVNLNKGKKYSIARITIHDGYKHGMFYHDIALLTLTREVGIRNFNTVCLPDAELSRKDLTDFGTTIVGWSSNKPYGPISNYQQQLSGLRIMSNRGCSQVYRGLSGSRFRHQFPRGINGEFICAILPDSDGKDTCGFLSGGALMYKERSTWFAVGILSFGYSCGHPEIPGGYIRISNYLDWISENTKD